MKRKLISIFFVTTVVLGYGSASGSTSSGNDSGAQENEENTSKDLTGTWLKSCSAVDKNDPETLYDIIELNFSNGEVSSDILNFIDPQCLTPLSFSPNPTASGVFVIGGNVTTDGGETGTKIDTHIETFNGAPFEIDEFGIYFIDDNNLYLGDTRDVRDGSTPGLRPTSLDYNRVFIRQ